MIMKNDVSKTTDNLIRITFNFVDSFNKNIINPITLSGKIGENIIIPWKEISGYVLSYIDNFQTIFTQDSQQVTMIYTKHIAAPVVVFHRDISGRLLNNPEYLTGTLNSPYHIKPLKNQQNAVVTSKNLLIGDFSNKSHVIRLTYDNMNLEHLNDLNNSYLFTLESIPIFKYPFSNNLLSHTIPKNTTWKIYKTVRDKIQKNIWINLGSDIWLPLNDKVNILSKNPTIQKKQQKLSLNYQVVNKVNFNKKIILSPDYTLWTFPYKKFKKNIDLGYLKAIITSKITLDNSSTWYKLDSGYYIQTKYIDIDD